MKLIKQLQKSAPFLQYYTICHWFFNTTQSKIVIMFNHHRKCVWTHLLMLGLYHPILQILEQKHLYQAAMFHLQVSNHFRNYSMLLCFKWQFPTHFILQDLNRKLIGFGTKQTRLQLSSRIILARQLLVFLHDTHLRQLVNNSRNLDYSFYPMLPTSTINETLMNNISKVIFWIIQFE